MSKLQQLIEAAKAATPGPWRTGKDGQTGILAPYRTGGWASVLCCEEDDCGSDVKANINPTDLTFIALANPATILELCALLEKADGALSRVEHVQFHQIQEAIAAIKKWKEPTKPQHGKPDDFWSPEGIGTALSDLGVL